MATLAMKLTFERDLWIARFATRLRELQPTIGDADAMDIAYSEYLVSCDYSPEEAAEDYAHLKHTGWLQRFAA